jgi:hypothetical protein
MPSGLAWRQGALYVAEVNRILRFDDVEARIDAYASKARSPVVVMDRFPSDRHHGWKFIRFGPDGNALCAGRRAVQYLRAGPGPPRLIARIRPDGSGYEVVARGVRNSVGFDWHPETKELWFTDNGRDMLGDDLPSDELNRVTRDGAALRLSVLSPGRHTRPGSRFQRTGTRLLRLHAAGVETRCSCGVIGHAFLYRLPVSGRLPEQHDHCGTRFVEPVEEIWLSAGARGH